MTRPHCSPTRTLPFFVPLVACAVVMGQPARQTARQIFEETGVQGGLVVHVGCGDGELTAALGEEEPYLVHGLDTDPANVAAARLRLGDNLYGKVAVDHFDGRRLPYIDNLVNLIVATNVGAVPQSELMRVLAPNGVAYVRSDRAWTKTVKPRPAAIDEWTHYLHDPQGTMVANDSVVGLPRRMQWVGDPKWLRNHDFMASLSAMVSSGGRIFYIIDEGLRYHIYLPARWSLVARDAFNGAILWKRPIDQWFPHTWPFKSGPGDLPRRLVAQGDRLYVTLGLTGALSALDAATGRTIQTYDATEGTEEIVLADGVLYIAIDSDTGPIGYKHATSNRGKERDRVNSEFGWSKQSRPRLAKAISAETGGLLWEREDRIAPLTLAVEGQTVFYYDGEHVVARDRQTGEPRWTSEKVGDTTAATTGYLPRLMVDDEAVVLSTKGRGLKPGRLVGLSAKTGDVLWRSQQLNSGHFSPEDLYLIDGLVWTADTGGVQTKGTHFQAIDAKTGDVKRDFIAKQIEAFFMHQRCYPGRATSRYIMTSGTGTELLELGTEDCELHHWLRGSCIYGLMPCNGLLYKTPDSCACYYQSKLPHFCALAPAAQVAREPASDRLERGPAYNRLARSRRATTDSWPTYRHDNARSGAAKTSVSDKLDELWETHVGGRLSSLTAADGRLFVAAVDRHTVHALSADSGRDIWAFTAGGRVDGPPTIVDGRALFGSADGWVYCLDADTGQLCWRFRVAPTDARLVSYQQVESVWPVHGSILVRDGVAYCLAGRSMFLDGGLRLVRLDCATGKLLSETVLDDKDPRTGKNLQTLMAGKGIPVANADLLSCDDTNIYMAAQQFDFEGQRRSLELVKGKEHDQSGPGRHLFCPTGFLDDVWFHRSYWIYGKNAGEGHGEYPVPRNYTPTGRLMAFDESRIYGLFAQDVGNNINPRTSYTLYAADKDLDVAPAPVATNKKRQKAKPAQPQGKIRYHWQSHNPAVLANALVLADELLFLAGPADVADETKTFDYVYGADDEINRQMRRQEEAWRGEHGALISVVSAVTGKELSQYKIDAIPVWDGMIAAGGRLYIAQKNDAVLCMGAKP